MTINNKINNEKLLKKYAKKLFAEAPDNFTTTLVFTEDKFVCASDSRLNRLQEFAFSFISEQISDNKNINGHHTKIVLDIEGTDFSLCAIAVRTGINVYGKQISAEEVIFTLMHEAMHSSLVQTNKSYKDMHKEEIYADAGAYLLCLREIGNNDFLEIYPYNVAYSAISDISYNTKAAHYTSDGLLAVKDIATRIDVKKLTFENIKTIAASIADEFSLTENKRIKIHNALKSPHTAEDNLIIRTYNATDKEIYKAGRRLTLSEYFKSIADMDKTELLFQAKDKDMDIIMNPLEEKTLLKKKSKTLNLLKKLNL